MRVEREASNIWCNMTRDLKPLVKCFVSIGTGKPGVEPLKDSYKFLTETLVQIVTETEETAENFAASWASQLDRRQYFRFNVEQGLQGIGLEEYNKKREINSATQSYLNDPQQKLNLRYCTQNLSLKESVYIENFA